MIVNQDEKFTKTAASIEGSYQTQEMFNAFIKLYPEDWKQLKINYSKFKRSKQFGKTIPLPKPEQALKKLINSWLIANKKR